MMLWMPPDEILVAFIFMDVPVELHLRVYSGLPQYLSMCE